MAQYFYTALDTNGTFIKGTQDARNLRIVRRVLKKNGFHIVNIQQEKRLLYSKLNHMFVRITPLDLIFFARYLHTMLEAGISLDSGLQAIAKQTSNIKLKNVIEGLYKKIQKGTPFGEALESYPKCFTPFFISAVKLGEQSGRLEEILAHLLEQLEKDYDLVRKVRGAMMYPAVIIAAAIGILFFMMGFVVPKIVSILSEYSVELPLTTRALMYISDFVVNYGVIAIPAVAIGIPLLIRIWLNSETGKEQWSQLLLKIPVIRNIVLEFNIARITRAMASLMESGIPMDRSLKLSASITRNTCFRKTLNDAIILVEKGVSLNEILKGNTHLYPPIVIRMVEVGEQSGTLDRMLSKVAIFYEKSVTNTLNNLSTIIEPVLLLLVGLIVAFIGLGILTPIWKFTETV